jgi:HEAT repeat protein
LTDALEPALVPLARHPDAGIRTKALVLVARSSSEAAGAAVVAGLEDASEDVQRVALSAVGVPRGGSAGRGGAAGAQATAATAKLLATHGNWAIRILAARALGRLGASGQGGAGTALEDAATHDSYALVREAALEALASFDAPSGRALAARMAANDPEPRVRDTAKGLAR